jgi:hypothetical protein
VNGRGDPGPKGPREAGGLTLSDLTGHPTTVLKDEGDGAARVVRCELPGGPVILKEWKPRGRILGVWARWIMRREIRHSQRLRGVPGIPRYLGHDGDDTLIVECVEGSHLRRRLQPALLRKGLDSLQETLQALHARRFLHLDLHQKRNTLIDGHGRAWLVDLGQGVDCSRGLARLIFPLLAPIDRRAVLKFRARYAPDTLDPRHRDELVARFAVRRRRWPKVVGRRLRRLLAD